MTTINKKITASDVALYAGVSRSSVSRAFTEGASINPEKQKRILIAATKLGYQPNYFARTLSTPSKNKRSHLIAILVSDLSNPYESYLFEELVTALQLKGKQPMLLNVKQAEDLDEAILRLSGYQVDAVIAVVGSLPVERFSQCLRLKLPLVTLGRSDEQQQVPSVQTDNRKAGELAANYMISQGLHRLGFIAGRIDGQASIERFEGFRDIIRTNKLADPIYLSAGRYGYNAGFELGIRENRQLHQLEGLFCASDSLAIGVIDSCRQAHGPKIPSQLRIIGCDDIPQAAWQGYQLTTIAQPVKHIAQCVIELLNKIGNHQVPIPMVTRILPELIIRHT